MRTNIDIDDALMAQALAAGPYRTKKEAVEAGLRLVARQAAYREVLKWRGKLRWEGDESVDWTQPAPDAASGHASGAAPRAAPGATAAPPPVALMLAEPVPPGQPAQPPQPAGRRRGRR
jgi:Arc/MetJ family transcription regulator